MYHASPGEEVTAMVERGAWRVARESGIVDPTAEAQTRGSAFCQIAFRRAAVQRNALEGFPTAKRNPMNSEKEAPKSVTNPPKSEMNPTESAKDPPNSGKKPPIPAVPAISLHFSGVVEACLAAFSGKNPPHSRISATFFRSCENRGEKSSGFQPFGHILKNLCEHRRKSEW